MQQEDGLKDEIGKHLMDYCENSEDHIRKKGRNKII